MSGSVTSAPLAAGSGPTGRGRSVVVSVAIALLVALGLCRCEASVSAPGLVTLTDDVAMGVDVHAGASIVPGTNPTGVTGPQSFHALEPGESVGIEWGFQGSHMAVFALRASEPGPSPCWVDLQFTGGGEVLASARLRVAELEAGDDGSFYAYDLFVITQGWEEWVDEPGVLRMELSDDEGALVGVGEVPVTLSAPPPL